MPTAATEVMFGMSTPIRIAVRARIFLLSQLAMSSAQQQLRHGRDDEQAERVVDDDPEVLVRRGSCGSSRSPTKPASPPVSVFFRVDRMAV